MVVALKLNIGARAKKFARVHVLFVIVCAAVAGCSGGGLLFGDGPHSMEAARLNSIVQVQSRAYNVPPLLIHAVITQENGRDIYSDSGVLAQAMAMA